MHCLLFSLLVSNNYRVIFFREKGRSARLWWLCLNFIPTFSIIRRTACLEHIQAIDGLTRNKTPTPYAEVSLRMFVCFLDQNELNAPIP
jgi:hypothetical protein